MKRVLLGVALAVLAGALVSGGVRTCAVAPPALRAPELEPRSVRGWLRVSAWGPGAPASQRAPLRHVSVYVNGRHYDGMRDNDLRGFLDGRFRFGWNQATQVHVRAGRRAGSPRYGEHELFRALQRWDGIELPPRVRVQRVRLEIAVEKLRSDETTVMLYPVRADWDPGQGGAAGDNNSPPRPGEVWWNERAHERAPWGLPGAGFASDTHPGADTPAMPVAEARLAGDAERLVFDSPRLAAYVQARARGRKPLLFLVKLADREEDASRSLLTLHSGERGEPWSPSLRPRLRIEWDAPGEIARLERYVHLEHGRRWHAPALDAPGARHLAASFVPDPGHAAPTLELRTRDGGWHNAALPLRPDIPRVDLRLTAARNPLVLGQPFRTALRDTWIRTGPLESQQVRFTFVGPDDARHAVDARYAGDYRFELAFTPEALGRWRYWYAHDFDEPFRGPVGVFDVVIGDRENARRQLRALLERIRAADPASPDEAIQRFGAAFRRLQRAALRLETPESFLDPSGRELFDLLTIVREALSGEDVPDAPPLRALDRDG